MDREKHPAYGLVQISRVSGRTYLVGSEVQHMHFFEMRVKEADRQVYDGEVRYSSAGGRILAILHLSPNQLMDLFTNMNVGEGTPCTLRYVTGDKESSRPRIEREPSRIQVASDYAKERANKRREETKEKVKKLREMISGLSGKKQTEIMKIVNSISEYFDANSNYFHVRITEATEKSIEIAKTEIEAHTQSVIRSLGISSLKALDAAIESKSLKEVE